ncbi:MAG TPA: DUF3189 family protein [Hydrogenispora sp.]|nr:DUF3189 family protein [Hydrogenispora sp.]
MKVIYHCYGRAHSSVVASHLHLGTLPLDGPVSKEQIMAIPEFDRAEAADFGEPYLVGQDEAGNEVYILGLNSQAPLCVRAILSLAGQLGLADQIILVNTLTEIGMTTRIGGFISKKLRYPQLGKPLAARGIIQSLPRLRQLVRVVKKEIVRKRQDGKEENYLHYRW